jgi:hypothetical protein
MEIVLYDPSRKDEWDSFVLRSNNGTMFHLQHFLGYHTPDKFPFHHLMFHKNGKLRAILPGGLDRLKIYESPVGSSYGSFVTGDIKFHETLEIIDSFEDYCWKEGIREVYLTSAPFIYQKELSHNLEYALLYRGFVYQRHYISHVIRLNELGDILRSFQKTTRNIIRHSIRENLLVIEESDCYDEFYPILVKNKQKHDAKPTHTLEELSRLHELLGDRIRLLLVRQGRRAIGGIVTFHCNEDVLLLFYIAMLYEYQHLRPIYRSMFEIIKRAKEEGYKFLDTGVSQDTRADNPMTPSLDLIFFKEKFNSRGILRSTFWKKLK